MSTESTLPSNGEVQEALAPILSLPFQFFSNFHESLFCGLKIILHVARALMGREVMVGHDVADTAGADAVALSSMTRCGLFFHHISLYSLVACLQKSFDARKLLIVLIDGFPSHAPASICCDPR